MGVFSWMTADTEEQVLIGGNDDGPVYLLDNKGKVYEEACYGGYGIFGGKDAYELLAEMNGFSYNPTEEEAEINARAGIEFRNIGIDLMYGSFYMDMEDGQLYIDGKGEKYLDFVKRLTPFHGDPIEEFGGLSINDMIESGRMKSIPMRDLIVKGSEFYPIKIMASSYSKYDDWEESETDPDQGGYNNGYE